MTFAYHILLGPITFTVRDNDNRIARSLHRAAEMNPLAKFNWIMVF